MVDYIKSFSDSGYIFVYIGFSALSPTKQCIYVKEISCTGNRHGIEKYIPTITDNHKLYLLALKF